MSSNHPKGLPTDSPADMLERAAARAGRLRTNATAARKLLYVSTGTDWEALEELRAFIQKHTKRHLTSSLAERTAFVCQELLECAVKFGSVAGELVCELSIPSTDAFDIRISSDCVPTRIGLLKRAFDNVMSMPVADAMQHAVKSVAAGQMDELELALARIRGENVELSLDAANNRRVTFIAVGKR